MRKLLIPSLKYIFAAFLALFLLGGEPDEFGKDKTFFHDYLIPKPVIHIGLGINLSQIKISASSGMKIYEVKKDYHLIAENATQAFVKGNREKLTEKYLIQVAQFPEQEEAERRAQELRFQIDRKVTVSNKMESGFDGPYKIMIGDFLTRDDALSYIIKLNRMEIKDTWIVREEVTEKESRPLWILINDELKSLRHATVLYFIPSSPQSYLSFKGRDYRGIFTLRASRKGIVLINTLNLEDYIKSVVPSELSPYNFPEIEAHKAQAIAARTYAMKNLGQYKELGFDLVDTPQSQFYRGMNAEHPLSNEAVESTRGMVAKYKGRLIDALYTSTCGGATEDVEKVFLGPALPYLRSTQCVYEKQKQWPLASQTFLAPVYAHGRNIGSSIALLISLGVIDAPARAEDFREPAAAYEVQQWLVKARSTLSKPKIEGSTEPEGSDITVEAFVQRAVQVFEWEGRVTHLLQESEKDFIFSSPNGWSESSRPYVAYLIRTGVFPSTESVGRHDRALTRGEAAFYIAQMLSSYRDFRDAGVFQGMQGNQLMVRENGEVRTFSLSPSAFLIQNQNSHRVFTRELDLLGGENMRWILREGQIVYLEVLYPTYSNLLDRSSKYHSWTVRTSHEDLSRRINRYYPVGDLIDLIPQERGSSERVMELLILGSETQATVRGLRIRSVLGLRETLFVLDKEHDAEGHVSHYIFTGKGWGHGVGLCQVGAYGMAQSGATYQEILFKYYRDITLDQIYH
jgi:stage II sporulation protein D